MSLLRVSLIHSRLEGALDGREGFVPTAYVKPKAKDEAKDDAKDDAMKEGSAPPSADSKHFLGQMESYNTPLKERPNLAKVYSVCSDVLYTCSHALYLLTYALCSLIHLSQAVQMHHVKAKHMPPQSSANGLHEFKRQVTQIKQGGRAKKQESEFELALRRRSEHVCLALQVMMR